MNAALSLRVACIGPRSLLLDIAQGKEVLSWMTAMRAQRPHGSPFPGRRRLEFQWADAWMAAPNRAQRLIDQCVIGLHLR